jgi:hypothetical protein
MKAIDFIATSLKKRDEKANHELALEIIKGARHDWIKELADNLNNKDKNIQSDCIKVLYEIGENGSPQMIAPYLHVFGNLLNSKNNRLIWGAMIAIDMIASVNPKGVHDLLPSIKNTIDKGSVITIDHGVGILAKLSIHQDFAKKAFPLLIEQLAKCPIKQLPMYAEKSIIAINRTNNIQFTEFLESRLPEIDKDSQKKRVEKITSMIKKRYISKVGS